MFSILLHALTFSQLWHLKSESSHASGPDQNISVFSSGNLSVYVACCYALTSKHETCC